MLDLTKVQKAIDADEGNVDLPDRKDKVYEELGEFVQAYLAWKGAKNASASAMRVKDKDAAVLEESIDVVLTGLDLTYAVAREIGADESDMQNMLDKKLAKWKAKQISN